MVSKNRLIVILGPTASGKTSLSVELAKWLGTEIISADSRQVFREMRIGTARPSYEQLQEARHHLIGHVSISEQYSAGRFEEEALEIANLLFREHDDVLLAGGTGLYIDALCNGLDELPDADPDIRNELNRLIEHQGIRALQELLLKYDPDYYLEVDLANPNRLIRALEVTRLTGKPYSSFRKGVRPPRPFEILKIGLDVPREQLLKNIHDRTDRMMEDGLLEEARSLMPFRSFNALNTVGYKELFGYLDGKCTLAEAVEKIKINTRRYAKRQMTWFRKDKEIIWFEPRNVDDIKKIIMK